MHLNYIDQLQLAMSQDRMARIISLGIKGVGILGFSGVVGLLLYNVATSEQAGRERALQYEKEHGKKKIKPMLPQELQPEYVEKQRRKYREILKNKENNERH